MAPSPAGASNEYGQATPPAGSFVSVSAGEGQHLRGEEQRLRRLLGLRMGIRPGPRRPRVPSSPSAPKAFHSLRGEERRLRRLLGLEWGFGQATPPAGSFVSVSTSARWYTCGVMSDGSVACWGKDVGSAKPPRRRVPSSPSAPEVNHTCGVRSNGFVACWGSEWGWPGHAARGFLRLRQRRVGQHLRGEERRVRRLLGRQ